MRILVTGGAGFIGSHVVDAYIAAGHDVAVVDNLHTGKRKNVHPKARFYQVDIRDVDALARVFEEERPEIISHQAALANVRESMEKPAVYAEVNIIGSVHLLELARKFGTRKIIYASTGGAVYGEPLFLPATEEHPIRPLDNYGASKHAVEHYLYLYKHNYGVDYTILRYPNVYGPRQDPLGEAGVIAIFTGRMLRGEVCIINGSGEQQRDFLYVGDVAQANVLALNRGSGGIYNLGWGKGIDINTVFRKLAEVVGYHREPVYGPPKLGEVFRIYLDARKAREELEWEPKVSFEEGLARTVAYFREQQVWNAG